MFMPKSVDGAWLQIIPYANSTIDSVAQGFIEPEIPIETLYDIRHYIALISPMAMLQQAQAAVKQLPATFWEQRLDVKVRALVDLVEAFYRGIACNDAATTLMLFGLVIQCTLEPYF